MIVQLGSTYDVELKVLDRNGFPVIDDIVTATIINRNNNKYFNGLFWVNSECELTLPHKEDGNYSITILFDIECSYSIDIKSNEYKISSKKEIQVIEQRGMDSKEEIDEGMGILPRVELSHSTLRNQDGSDTTIVDVRDNPLPGVIITCYDSKTKEVVAVSQSDINGHWGMFVKHGVYFFTFESDGYITTSFERTVDICQ